MEKKAHIKAGSTEVAEQLPMAGAREIVSRFHLDDDLSVDQQIHPLKPNDFALEVNRNVSLSFNQADPRDRAVLR